MTDLSKRFGCISIPALVVKSTFPGTVTHAINVKARFYVLLGYEIDGIQFSRRFWS